MPKSVSIRVSSLDADLEFSVAPSTTGRQLFDQVAKTLGVREVWYFGLQTLDSENRRIWLKYSKKVLPQITKYYGKIDSQNSAKKPHVSFLVKFFPEDIEKELIQEITLKLFYLQVKESIVEGEIFCNPEVAVLLASYAAQAKFGDYDNDRDYTQFMKTDRWLPGRIIVENRMTLNQWQDRILEWYAEHRGMLKEDAMMEYLKIAQELEMYGVNYFQVTNKKHTPLVLGVDALGLNIYDDNNRLTPRLGFSWNEIRFLHSHNKKFLIKPVDRKTHDFILYSTSQRMNKQVLLLAAGNHQMYKRRRDGEPLEVIQMRLSAKAEKDAKLAERRALYMERMQRMEAERNRAELEDKLQKYQSQYHLAIQELEKSKSNLHLNSTTEDETDGEIIRTEKKPVVHVLERSEDFSDESKSLREKIARMKEEIDERRTILKLILENNTNSTRKRDSVKSLLKVYSSILPSGEEKAKDDAEEDDYKLIRERIEALNLELSDVKRKTQEARRDLTNARKQHKTTDILDKQYILKYFSEEKDERDI